MLCSDIQLVNQWLFGLREGKEFPSTLKTDSDAPSACVSQECELFQDEVCKNKSVVLRRGYTAKAKYKLSQILAVDSKAENLVAM